MSVALNHRSVLLPLTTAYAGFCPHTGEQHTFLHFVSVFPSDFMTIRYPRSPRANAASSCDQENNQSNPIAAHNPPPGSPFFR